MINIIKVTIIYNVKKLRIIENIFYLIDDDDTEIDVLLDEIYSKKLQLLNYFYCNF